jgi:hypothetical protein
VLLVALDGWPGGGAGAKRNAVGDQCGKIRRGEADTRCGLAVVLDVGQFVQVVGKGARQVENLGVGLRVPRGAGKPSGQLQNWFLWGQLDRFTAGLAPQLFDALA